MKLHQAEGFFGHCAALAAWLCGGSAILGQGKGKSKLFSLNSILYLM